ncbi:hypothetical protein NDU88_003200 [Pleurodeles waltl]|uniref:Uncharacterized protein n=1 Tax=Pleurodeles waltl TaxID=8319 RepID=A0AAV7TMR9_PLEWA|nr:hypothetical protein NDU88_003200 [Pleurodeles waltl]
MSDPGSRACRREGGGGGLSCPPSAATRPKAFPGSRPVPDFPLWAQFMCHCLPMFRPRIPPVGLAGDPLFAPQRAFPTDVIPQKREGGEKEDFGTMVSG